MPVAGAVIAGVGALASSVGASRQQRAQNRITRRAANMMSPSQILASFKQLNPQLHAAAYGPNPFKNYQGGGTMAEWLDNQAAMAPAVSNNPLAALFHAPGYIDPRMMNFGLQQNREAESGAMQAGLAMLGRHAFQGGVADAFAMANMGLRTRNDNMVYNNYANARAQKTTSDLATGEGMRSNALEQAGNFNSQRAGIYGQQRAPTNFLQSIGQGASSAIGAYGAMKSITPQATQSFTQGNPFAPPSISAPGWSNNFNYYQPPTSIPFSPGGGNAWQAPQWAQTPAGGWR